MKQFNKNAAVKSEAESIVKNEILPKFKILQDYIYGEYQNHLRKGPGLVSLGNLKGTEFYQGCLKYSTTLENPEAEDLHKYGLEANAKSKQRFVELAIELGHGGQNLTFAEAVEAVTNDPSYVFESSDEIMEAFQDEIDNIIPRLKTIFHEEMLTENVLTVNVKPVPAGGGGIAYYRQGSVDGRREGTYIMKNIAEIDEIG